MKNLMSVVLLGIFTLLLAFFANKAYEASIEYENEYIKYAQTRTVSNNAQAQVEHLIVNVLGSLLKSEIQKEEKENEILKLKELKNKTINNFMYFFIILIISIFSYFLINKLIFLSYLHLVTLMTLFLGLFSPIFLMYVTTTIGSNEIILQFESSNILSSIDRLLMQNNYFVAGIIFLFSILFPLIKTNLSLLALFLNNANIISKLTRFLSKFNKFSMADVFVLSIFLVYLSPNESSVVKTNLEIGFYFFFTYVILSLFIGLISNKNKIN